MVIIAAMTYAQLIKYFGSQAKAARELGIPQTTISSWRHGIPKWRQSYIQLARKGRK